MAKRMNSCLVKYTVVDCLRVTFNNILLEIDFMSPVIKVKSKHKDMYKIGTQV